jgi:hypothetical protein
MGKRTRSAGRNETTRPRSTPASGSPGRRLWLPLVVLAALGLAVTVFLVTGRSRGGPEPAAAPADGTPAPSVRLPATTGKMVDLTAYRGKRNVLLYFYEHAG